MFTKINTRPGLVLFLLALVVATTWFVLSQPGMSPQHVWYLVTNMPNEFRAVLANLGL